MTKTFKPSSHDMRPGWMQSGELKTLVHPEAAEACTGIGDDYKIPRPHFLERITAASFWRGYAAILTLLMAGVAAGYLWASYGPR